MNWSLSDERRCDAREAVRHLAGASARRRALSLRTVNERERAVSQFAADTDVAPHVATTSDVASWLARGQWTGSTRHTYWTHLERVVHMGCALDGYRPDNPMTPLAAPNTAPL